jgi:hypothetical protein
MIDKSKRRLKLIPNRISFPSLETFARGSAHSSAGIESNFAVNWGGWRRSACLLFVILSTNSLFLAPGFASDWPQLLGPNRDGQAVPVELHPEQWPERLEPNWKIPLGSGYAGAAIAGNTVFVPHRLGNSEVLTAIELETGEKKWESKWTASYRGSINPDNGPRCVPVVAGDRIVCYGAAGDLVCLQRSDGSRLWERALREEYDAKDGYFGAGSTPIVVNDLVIVCVGGRDGGIVAIELDSGRTRWTSTSYDASYSSPIHFKHGSEDLLLVVTRLKTLLMHALDGSVFSEVDFGSRGPTVNAATPIAIGSTRFLLTASYGVGTLILNVDGIELREEFREPNLLASQYNTPIKIGDRILGIQGREDMGFASLRALDSDDLSVLWEQNEFGIAHLIGIGDRVLALGLDGALQLIDATADNFQPLASSLLPTGTYRALPALSGRRLIIRASHGPTDGELMMFELL